MIASALRRARFYSVAAPARTYTNSNSNFNIPIPRPRSRAIDISPTRFSRDAARLIINQHARFSTDVDAEPFKTHVLVEPGQDLPEIYASPASLLEKLTHSHSFFRHMEIGCKSIFINKDGNDEEWHTATYIHSQSREYFHSGKFGDFIKRFEKHPSFSSEETCVVDGKIYYPSEDVAKEAAAARALDCAAFRSKYSRKMIRNSVDIKKEPLRYCVELPYMFAMTGEADIHKDMKRNAHAPSYYWKCLMQEKYGPIEVKFDLKSTTLDCETASSDRPIKENWYSATCIEPKTGEAFDSGVFGLGIVGKSWMPDSPTTPLTMEEIHIMEGMVYYRDEPTAIHAAAARAIDCMDFRTLNKEDVGSNEENIKGREINSQLCMEEPYLTMDDKRQMQQTNYEGLKAIVAERRSIKPGFCWEDFLKSHSKKIVDPSTTLSNAIYQMLNSCHSQTSTGRRFELTALEEDDCVWYTSTFTDPITKEAFPSGILRVPEDPLRIQSIHVAAIRVVDGKVYYNDVLHARNAASARALDCYLYREKMEEDISLKLCFDDPYKTAEEGASLSMDYEAIMAQRDIQLPNAKTCLSANEIDNANTPFLSLARSIPYLLHVPKSFMNIVFERHTGMKNRLAYHIQKRQHGDESWLTATFTDPMTKESFPSGLGLAINVEKRQSAILATPLHQAETKIFDGKVYYRQGKLAEHAAAALRALDCYFFREGSASKIGVRLCMEEPYSIVSDRDAQQIDCEEMPNKRNLFGSENSGICKNDSNKDGLPTLDVSIAEEAIPKVDNTLSTMGRIAEIFIDTSINSSGGASLQWPIELTRECESSQSPSAKIESILDWYGRVNNEPQNYEEASALAKLCNRLLSALGNANTGLYLNAEENHINVEKDAKIILDKIVALSTSFDDESGPSFLDASTFNAYIHCLSRLDPTRSAESAKDLLQRMVDREKFSRIYLPPPNVGTYNAVMSLWALVDGIDGQNGASDIYSLLESATLGGGGELSLKPNIETFKILLRINSKKIDGRFSFEQAKLWLSRIEQISVSICGETLIPDADIYNAALTPLSDKFSTKPKNDRLVGTLFHGVQYDGGFKIKNEDSNSEATDIAKWLLYAEECGVHPNTDMYEAVIQAYTKTGTKDALLVAEGWAKRAVASSSPTRLATFHPIIAAWALCQFEHAPTRVKEWMNQLEVLSSVKPHLKPDLSTLSAQIVAWWSVQAGLMTRLEESGKSSSEENLNNSSSVDCRDMEIVFASAQNCTRYLGEIRSNWSELGSSQDVTAMVLMLALTVEAWGSASRFALLHPTSSVQLDTSHGVHEMLRIARFFDDEINQDEPNEEQAQLTLHLMGEVFVEVVSQLRRIDSSVIESDDSMGKSYFFEEIPDVERMLRDYEFYSRKHFSSSNFTSESVALRHRFYKELLRGCARVQSSADYGHCVRLCRLIMDHLSWQDEQCHDSGDGRAKEDITDVYVDIALLMGTVVKSEHEKMYVLTTAHNNADRFFEKRRKSEASNYAEVDQARLIGAMRMAMGDSDLTETFLSRFDKYPPRNKARGNTALAFVEDMLKNKQHQG
eukprot:CAMPEP_0181132354 /NCGR_PEP_ID=MMETSP1071-20121207/30950_1 /TAXON_ID=35127 /ORGANISM="Thalassiosira sp., Strain NH16" /LENGTH=1560 /DNA_ID=CAMNT_0023218681 /DNA_START=227 /DNA_END=4909 /DNA_ORIENTATION=-